jgi:cell division protein FtsI (penicillin-binding protein 3)
LRRFGFGEPSGVPLPGEASGVLRPRGHPWVQVETAVASFGQGISVTAMQMATAVSALANGGRLLEPLLIRRVTDGTGAVVREGVPHVRREAVSPAVARTVAEMMVAVTEGEGTGVEAAIAGFRVAGKTATAQKADPATGKYTADRFTSSFIGFVPAERPRIAVVVVLDEPALARAGGAVAAPAFRRIAEMSLRYLGVVPKASKEVPLAKLTSDPDPATATLAAMRPAEPAIRDVPGPAVVPSGSVRIPDMRGWSTREAAKATLGLGLLPAVDGTGMLQRQDPPAGAVLPKGSTVKLWFLPPT